MNILISGSGGFIGGHMVRYLRNLGHNIIATDILPTSEWQQRPDEVWAWGKFDLRTPEMQEIFDWERPDAVIHLASDMGGIGYITQQSHATLANTFMDANVITAALDYGVRKFFYASSACVYPTLRMETANYAPMTEADVYPAYPNELYGWQKLHTEHLLQSVNNDMQVYIGRFHNVMGPYCQYDGGREKAPAALCRKVAQAKLSGSHEIEVWGDGQQERSFVYVGDVCRAVWDLMQTSHHAPVTIGPDQSISINDLVDLIAKVADWPITPRHIPGPVGVMGRHFDHGALRGAIGWVPEGDFEMMMRETYQWVEKQVRDA